MQAREVTKRVLEAREAGDSWLMDGVATEAMRRGLMAADATGALDRARRAALQAESLARTRSERYRVAMLRVLLECESGHHRLELQQARRGVALDPRSAQAWMVLRRAAICNGRSRLARQAGERIEALEKSAPH